MADVACFTANRLCRRDDDIDVELDKLGGDLCIALFLSLRPGIRDRDDTTIDPAEFAQSLYQCGEPRAMGYGYGRNKQPDDWQLASLLCVRRERPSYDTYKERNKLPSSFGPPLQQRKSRHTTSPQRTPHQFAASQQDRI